MTRPPNPAAWWLRGFVCGLLWGPLVVFSVWVALDGQRPLTRAERELEVQRAEARARLDELEKVSEMLRNTKETGK